MPLLLLERGPAVQLTLTFTYLFFESWHFRKIVYLTDLLFFWDWLRLHLIVVVQLLTNIFKSLWVCIDCLWGLLPLYICVNILLNVCTFSTEFWRDTFRNALQRNVIKRSSSATCLCIMVNFGSEKCINNHWILNLEKTLKKKKPIKIYSLAKK